MKDMDMDMNPSNLCNEFARILGSTPSVVNGVCLATRSRTNLHPVVLGRKAEAFMFVPQAFSFEDIDRDGNGLCLGETVILQKEIEPFMSRLREHGIIVTALHNHWLFDHPRLMYMHFESIDDPLSFARKVRDAMKVLISHDVYGKSSSRNDEFNNSYQSMFFESKLRGKKMNPSDICDEFNRILGGTMHTFENEQCTVMRSRLNIKPEVLGRLGRSFLLIPQMFTFESMTDDGRALCSGETVILQEEINPFISVLREHDIIVTAVHNHWLFEDPRLMFMHWESIDNPLTFARKVRDALSVLTTKEVVFRR
jgi:hypothetical protein